jgi:hypothetical protein
MEMIMGVLAFCVFLLSRFCSFFPRRKNLAPRLFCAAKNFRETSAKLFCGKQKTHSAASGLEFRLIALTTNPPLASYLGGSQNRNQYE